MAPRARSDVRLKLRVTQGRRAADGEPERDRPDDVAVAPLSLEAAGSVAEATLLGAEASPRAGRPVHDVDGDDRVRHLLPVGADVLDGRRAHAARDAAQALDPREALIDREGDQLVPLHARADLEVGLAVLTLDVHAVVRRADHKPLEGFVVDEDVATAAEHEHRQLLLARPGERLSELRVVDRLRHKGRVPARRASWPARSRGYR